MNAAATTDILRTTDIPPAARLVWLCLENHADDSRVCHMAAEAMAIEIGLGIATVRRSIRSLRTRTIIAMTRPATFRLLRQYDAHPIQMDQNDRSGASLWSFEDAATDQFDRVGGRS